MTTQWHPVFAQLLRPLLEGYFEVQTNVPVGDAPRQADLVLLQRTSSATSALPFKGVWRYLTCWNILEYKGPTVSARHEHLDLLVELGLGIHRRLNEERAKTKKKPLPAADVSFWYLNNDIGKRFLKRAIGKLGSLQSLGDGVWRGAILDRKVYLVSGVDLPVEADSLPFHILGIEPIEKQLSVARLIRQQPQLCELYTEFMGSLHPEILQELKAMGKSSKKGPQFHLKPLVDMMGLDEAIDQLGAKQILEKMGAKKIIREMGAKTIIDEVGAKTIIDEIFAHLSDEKRAELVREIEKAKGKKK
jgi:hypothetical protein